MDAHLPAAGERVRVRRQPWTIEAVEAGDACQLVTLSGIGRDNLGRRQRVVAPVDCVEPIVTDRRIRRASRRRWRAALRAALLGDDRFGQLKTLQSANVELWPHQLAPALAILSGAASRLLIADAVGLGKTLQAGLILAELAARGAAARALILCPAGLREQWASELASRFRITASIMDAATERLIQTGLPLGANPWSLDPVIVSSIDFVKRPEVLTLVASVRWDLLVVDEAHHAAAPSDRHDAVARLAAGAGHVVLLTATPHSGDADAFAALCRLGAIDDDAVCIFRRPRQAIGGSQRRHIRQIAVRMTPAERRMHAALGRFARALCAEHGRTRPSVALGLATLQKRACSSAHALELSVRRRLSRLAHVETAAETQLPLPWTEAGEFDAADETPEWQLPALADAGRERILLAAIADAAAMAAVAESKLAVLRRLLRRAGEPVLVFTEYRDTLLHVQQAIAPDAAVIHGGMSRLERRAAIERFARGGVLLATDAAGEGLNLQHACRLVVNLELPWNPMRLEQRIGRVDRIGQVRTVHAIHLVAHGTAEIRIRQRLDARIARADAAIGISDPLRSDPAGGGWCDEPGESRASAQREWEQRAVDECARLQAGRAMAKPGAAHPAVFEAGHVLLRAGKRRRLTAHLRRRTLVIYRSRVIDGRGSAVASYLYAAILPAGNGHALDLERLDALATRLDPLDRRSWLRQVRDRHHGYWTRRLARESLILALDTSPGRSSPTQPGLFDARQLRLDEDLAERRERALADAASRLEMLRRLADLRVDPPSAILVLDA